MVNSYVILIALCSVLAFQTGHTAPLAALKGAAKAVAEKAGDVAAKVEEVPKIGGVRQTALHAGLDLAVEKGLEVVGARYPAVKLVGKLAKPAMNKVHTKINDMFKKPEAGTDAKDVESNAEGETKETPVEAKETKEVKKEEAEASAAQDKPEEKHESEKKKGVIGKIKDLVKGDVDGKKKEEDSTESSDESEKTEEGVVAKGAKKEKKGIVNKIKGLVKGDEKTGEEKEVENESAEVKEPKEGEKKEGVLSKIGHLVKGEKKDEKESSRTEKESAEKKE